MRAEEGSDGRAEVGMGGLKNELRKGGAEGGVEGGAEMRKKERGEKAGR